jgi:hypothetical protein
LWFFEDIASGGKEAREDDLEELESGLAGEFKSED